jgi:sugar-specific transcriptional regulator TrmB
MEQELIKILTGIGLTDKEAKVYLACTEVGESVVSDISKSAKINRVTAYDILEKLKKKGLVGYITKRKTKYFTCIKPEILLEEFEKRTSELRTAIPKFKRLTGETNHPRVRYFEGLEGIKAIYADTLTSKTEILNFSNSEEIRVKWPTYDNEYVSKRAEKQIFLRGICPKDRAGEIVKAQDEKYHREMRLIPRDRFNFTNEINIYDDKVSIISFKDELIGMIIESVEIANSQRAIFDMCWQFAEIMGGNGIKTKLLESLTGKELEKMVEKSGIPEKEEKPNLSLF